MPATDDVGVGHARDVSLEGCCRAHGALPRKSNDVGAGHARDRCGSGPCPRLKAHRLLSRAWRAPTEE